MYQLVDTVINNMKSFYPELVINQTKIEKMIKAEEEKFILTLKNGENILNKLLENNKDNKIISGEDAFKLYDTYGFPFDLTNEICKEKGFQVDKEGFDKCMSKQKELARSARSQDESMHRQSKDLLDFIDPSTFVYSYENIKAKVIGVFKDGIKVNCIDDEGDIIFDTTNFYAESGGQVADIGTIENNNTLADVKNVVKAPNKQHLHHVTLNYGKITVGDIFELKIDIYRRLQIQKNHSATHLLQAALDKVLSNDIHQAGSFVCDEYVHFDFNYDKKLTREELANIESLVNKWISQAIPCQTKVLPIEEARKENAKALFDEKYGDIVRVVCFDDISKEFLGKSRRLVDMCNDFLLDVTQPELKSSSMTKLQNIFYDMHDDNIYERIAVMNLRHSLCAIVLYWLNEKVVNIDERRAININKSVYNCLNQDFDWVNSKDFSVLLDR